jgi:N-methylhydantoinase A
MPGPSPGGDLRVSADIGGTFTDLIALDKPRGRVIATKVSSRPEQPADSVLEGLAALTDEPARIESLVHGQTVGLNTFLQRAGARVVLLMTAGVRDAYTIARHDRRDLYALRYRKPERLVTRRDTLEVAERLRADGSVETPLDVASLEPVFERIERDGIEAVAVCFLHAYVNPVHELQVRELLLARFPRLVVSLSSDVAREWREYERASSAVVNAYVAPSIERYLAHLEERLASMGVTAPLRIMQSNGGVTSTRRARRLPIQTLLSGPVGGAIAAARLARASRRPNLLCADMGGTSFDVSLVVEERPTSSTETELEGLPLLLPLIDIHTIGAGGGSIAWLEAGGLRVGPRSAGASPGPACYGRGGREPTVTDANVRLGRLDPARFLGGRMGLDEDAARAALDPMADELGLSELDLAEGMLAVVNAAMADAIRTITVKQGIDPRDFSLVAFGGAGPMHAVALAQELEIREVIVPWSPGTFSAWGMLQTDIRQDFARSFYRPLDAIGASELASSFAELEREAAEALADDGAATADLGFVRTADLRYVGQEYSVAVALPGAEPRQAAERFHAAHRARYGHAMPEAPVEFVNLRVAVIGRVEQWPYDLASGRNSDGPVAGRRTVVFDGAAHEALTLVRGAMPAGELFAGPALIHDDSATTVVAPGWQARVDDDLHLVITAAS